MEYKKVILKKGKEFPIKNKHHWIFNGAIKTSPQFKNGEILKVCSSSNEILGYGYFNNDTVIAGRMLSFTNKDPFEALKENINNAINYRESIFDSTTNAYRIINGEGDQIPGLVVDRYNNVLVIQIATVGIENLKNFIIDNLVEALKPGAIYEKSTMPARKHDGLKPFEGVVYGKLPKELIISENGIKFLVDLEHSQKTGLFLDMREMRMLVGKMAKGRRVLNCFSYTGGFSLYAAQGGALKVDSVDIAADAVEFAKKNFDLNDLSTDNNRFLAADAFKFLREDNLDYDFIILDPPAFAKKKSDIENAMRGYREINKTTLQKIPPKSYLLTCSCSYHVNREMFEEIVTRAARDAKRNVKILQRQRIAMDHPININHSEIDYLKSLLLFVE